MESELAPGAPPDAASEPADDGGTPAPLRLVLQLMLAAGAGIVVLRVIAGLGDAGGGAATARSAIPGAGSADAGGRASATTVGATPVPAAAAPPEPALTYFIDLPTAGERLRIPVLQPSYLPPGAGPLSYAWKPDPTLLQPGDPSTGVLMAWYWTLWDGVMLKLAQGPWTGLLPDGAPAGEHGTVTLADGRRLVWVRGHSEANAPGGSGRRWTGDELRLGVPPSGAAGGWWLESWLLSLDELVRVAEGLR